MVPLLRIRYNSTHLPSFLDVSYDCRKLLTRLVHSLSQSVVQFDAVFAGNEAEERKERDHIVNL